MIDIKKVVDRFLCWPLPQDFSPDCYISFTGREEVNKQWPVGTNLFTADQARAMFEYCLADELQAIENQPVPVEPQRYAWTRDGMVSVTGNGEYVSSIIFDALQQVLQAEIHKHKITKQLFDEELADGDKLCSSLCFERTEGGRLPVRKMVSDIGNVAIRLKQAESRNKRLVELLSRAANRLDALDALITGELGKDWADFHYADWEGLAATKSSISELLREVEKS